MNYTTLVQIATDIPAQLRRGDVFRVVETAHHAGCLTDFCAWLSHLRPDLCDEIGDCMREVADRGYWREP